MTQCQCICHSGCWCVGAGGSGARTAWPWPDGALGSLARHTNSLGKWLYKVSHCACVKGGGAQGRAATFCRWEKYSNSSFGVLWPWVTLAVSAKTVDEDQKELCSIQASKIIMFVVVLVRMPSIKHLSSSLASIFLVHLARTFFFLCTESVL